MRVNGVLASTFRAGSTTYVNSIQQVSITIGSGNTSNTATISAVGSRAVIICLGWTSTTTSYTSALARIELTNSTTVTAYRGASTGDVVVNAVIIDADSSLVSSVQHGTVSISASTSGTATISSVNTTNSVVFWLGNTSTSGTDTRNISSAAVLTNSTTVTANCFSSSTNTVGFCVVEFNPSVINNIQKFSTTASGTTQNQTITSVVLNNSFIAWGGITSSVVAGRIPYAELSSSTTVTLTRNSFTAGQLTKYAVVEFIPGVLSSAQRGSIAGLSTTNTATISSADPTKSFANYLGNSSGGSISSLLASIDQTNSTTVTETLGAGGTVTTAGYEVLTFNQ